jgi:uncharacterized membrane protein
MTKTIGNPLSWGAHALGALGRDAELVVRELGGDNPGARSGPVTVRRIGTEDLRAALRAGWEDFGAMRSDVIAAALLYPVIGAALFWAAGHQNLLPLIFPLASGFAILGPAAAVGMYEMSRRREAGRPTGWLDGLHVLASPAFGAILALAALLFGIFAVWMLTAWTIFQNTLGPALPATAQAFLHDVLATPGGWAMIALGLPAGFVFAALVLSISVVAFPMLLDRHCGLPQAMATSLAVARRNPATVALWGLIVAVALLLGSLPLLLGLAVVLPVLGHATWHLYRRAVN